MLLNLFDAGHRVVPDRADFAPLKSMIDTWLQTIAETADKFEAEIEGRNSED